jgi:membrane protein implicated in regulation of membrane protease activity
MDAFTIYLVCFGVGLLFTIFSALTSHVFGGHGDTTDAQAGDVHAEGGVGASDMPGFAPLSPTTIATFITAFGGFGMALSKFGPTSSPWVSGPIAALGGFGIAVAVFWLFRAVFTKTQGSSEGRVAELAGVLAIVITPIAAGSIGEIAYVQGGTRYSGPARSEDGTAIANGATVRITRIVGTQFFVVPA